MVWWRWHWQEFSSTSLIFLPSISINGEIPFTKLFRSNPAYSSLNMIECECACNPFVDLRISTTCATIPPSVYFLATQQVNKATSSFLLMGGYTFPRMFYSMNHWFPYPWLIPNHLLPLSHLILFSISSSPSLTLFCLPLLPLPLLILRMSSTYVLVLLSTNQMQTRSKSSSTNLSFYLLPCHTGALFS